MIHYPAAVDDGMEAIVVHNDDKAVCFKVPGAAEGADIALIDAVKLFHEAVYLSVFIDSVLDALRAEQPFIEGVKIALAEEVNLAKF